MLFNNIINLKAVSHLANYLEPKLAPPPKQGNYAATLDLCR